MDEENKRLLHPKEAAYELGVSTKTIHRWDEAGKLRTVRTWAISGAFLSRRSGACAAGEKSRALCPVCAGIERKTRAGWESRAAN